MADFTGIENGLRRVWDVVRGRDVQVYQGVPAEGAFFIRAPEEPEQQASAPPAGFHHADAHRVNDIGRV